MPAVFLHLKNIWLHWVLVVAHRIFLVVECGTFFFFKLWHAGYSVVACRLSCGLWDLVP